MSNANINALNAFSTMVSVSAHNIANVSTPSFTSSRVALESMLAPNGVHVQNSANQNTSETPPEIQAERARLDSTTPSNPSQVDLAREMVNLNVAENGFAANVQAIRTEDEMSRQIIEMVT